MIAMYYFSIWFRNRRFIRFLKSSTKRDRDGMRFVLPDAD